MKILNNTPLRTPGRGREWLSVIKEDHNVLFAAIKDADKIAVYILSNVHYLYVLTSNNSNSLTSDVICKMAGNYYW